MNRALVQYGGVPTGIDSHLTPLITSATRQEAAQNPYSILEQLRVPHEFAQRMIPEQLAARGILSSGETPYQLGEEERRYAQAQYDAQNALVADLLGGYQGYAQSEQERALQYLQEQQAAAIRAQDRALQQQQMQMEMAFQQQQMALQQQQMANEMAMAQQAAQGGGQDPYAFIDSLFSGGGQAMPSQAEVDAIHSVTRKAARHRTQAEKDALAQFQAAYGPAMQYY